MEPERNEEAWVFRFAIEYPDGTKVPERYAQALLHKIVDWVEEQDLRMGGGYLRASTLEDPDWAEARKILRAPDVLAPEDPG